MRLYQSKALPTRCNTRTLFNWFKRNPELCLIRFKTYFLSFLHSCKHVIVQWWSYNCGKVLILTFCSRYVPLFHRTQLDLRNTAEYALCKKGKSIHDHHHNCVSEGSLLVRMNGRMAGVEGCRASSPNSDVRATHRRPY